MGPEKKASGWRHSIGLRFWEAVGKSAACTTCFLPCASTSRCSEQHLR